MCLEDLILEAPRKHSHQMLFSSDVQDDSLQYAESLESVSSKELFNKSFSFDRIVLTGIQRSNISS